MQDITVLFEDEKYVFAVKPPGVLSQKGDGDNMVDLLGELCGGEVYPVHRLDRAVGGVMVFAKTRESAAFLSDLIARGKMTKEYLAVVRGEPDDRGEMEDLLFKDSARNKSYVVKKERRGVKKARLEYEKLAQNGNFAVVKIKLHTGRSHQIRVQFASRKMPLAGDGKYGGGDNGCGVALWSSGISFDGGGRIYSFGCLPRAVYPWDCFDLASLVKSNKRYDGREDCVRD